MKKTIRAILMTLLLLAVVLPVSVYIVLSTPWAQDRLRTTAADALTDLLGSNVDIGRVDYEPFNTIAVYGITVADDNGRQALSVASVRARFELWHFVRTRRLVFDYAIVDVPCVNLSRASADAPLNIEGIIRRLSPKDKTKPPTPFDLRIATLVVRNGFASYNVGDAPATPGRFNPSHIQIDKLGIHAYLRHISNDDADVLLESLSFREASGFVLSRLEADAGISGAQVDIRRLDLRFPGSTVSFNPMKIRTDLPGGLRGLLGGQTFSLGLKSPAKITLADFVAFWPTLGKLDRVATVDFGVEGNLHHLDLKRLLLSDSRGTEISVRGQADCLSSSDSLRFDLAELKAFVSPADAAAIMTDFNPKAASYISNLPSFSLTASASGSANRASAAVAASVGSGVASAEFSAEFNIKQSHLSADGSLSIESFPAGTVLGLSKLGNISIPARFDIRLTKGHAPDAEIEISGGSVEWLGREFDNLFTRLLCHDDFATLQFASPNAGASLTLDADCHYRGLPKSADLRLEISELKPEVLGLEAGALKPGTSVAADIAAQGEGYSVDDICAALSVDNLLITTPSDTLRMKSLTLDASGSPDRRNIALHSDFINAYLEGAFRPSCLKADIMDLASSVAPALVQGVPHHHPEDANRFDLQISISNTEQLSKFFHLPVIAVYPVEANLTLDAPAGNAAFFVDAPYLQQGDKIIDSTNASVTVDAAKGKACVYAATHMPTKKGPMAVAAAVNGADNRFDTSINWKIERAIPLNGIIDFNTTLARDSGNAISIATVFNPGQINFGDDTWSILPSKIYWADSRLTVDNFSLRAGNQCVTIDGTASASPDDILNVELDKIVLISIFETLEIENALLTGTATGRISASQLFSPSPRISSPNLHVDDIGYNYCVLGNADITASWDNDRQGVRLDADIVNPENVRSTIGGYIFPTSESLDLDFDANHVKVGFMQPFMKAFASDISGFASGHARLYGTFHDIDMEGDIFAEDLRLRIDFTNTFYHATDSIHIRPGLIKLDNITLRDAFGNTARLDGILTHKYFHLPEFDFRISDARNFLCYDVTPKINPDWYGAVFGNGGARVKGVPGTIDIGVNMSTTKGSTFTFVLSDQLVAEQYSFITFNDATDYSLRRDILSLDDTPAVVKEYQRRMSAAAADQPSNYVMDVMVDITPDAQVNLVMDPVGGDRIRAYGSGDLRMTYNAFENDLRMYGTYTLDRGNYNFTLQDIIIKDFTIEPGSSIAFRGDPYSAQLDIEAVYQVNANLSDLDESFTQDKALNRTNVPVQALMKVTGDMRQPDIAFDLRFPTLTSDTYRKVRSIISTDDMMNRQIIYLLALNRFYTPDYMESTTKGNELFSVASSTISSQLSSMLGKLSENWSIAPNLRSDRGDFTDVEVDVALSSRLLNNRLLFNGNFGYRDNKLNSNQFIGDFDIEYLLNPRGTWRLKAYNRYNDQNYYVRSAATTQGLGILLRRDFDDIFRHKPRTCEGREESIEDVLKKTSETPADSTTLPTDSILSSVRQ